LTFEFLNEAIVGLSNSTEHVQQLCLDYMAPWLRNLEILAQRSTDDSEDNLAQTKNILRLLIDLTVRKNEVHN
jgi:neurofibromin 1